jgi:hypothetical protein
MSPPLKKEGAHTYRIFDQIICHLRYDQQKDCLEAMSPDDYFYANTD